MPNFNRIFALLAAVTFAAACQEVPKETGGGLPQSLSEVPAVRLSYRYEADVPAPTEQAAAVDDPAKFATVQMKFESTRPQEFVARTIGSPDGKRVAVVYNRVGDQPEDYRLDMYASDGTLLNKVTSDLMAVHFPDTIAWSPDSATIAFVAMLRAASDADENAIRPAAGVTEDIADAVQDPEAPLPDSNTDPGTAEPPSDAAPTPPAPVGILTFRTEQLYVADADGMGARPLTQNESLIYYYYVWSADSTKLATLAATVAEWQYVKRNAEAAGQVFVPAGRPRVVEKNGRERLLDDALTSVQPVWSPDSTKIACAFDKQVRLYDAAGNVPTQAAIPLRNNLLLSSQAYDRDQSIKLGASNANGTDNTVVPTNVDANAAPSTLPDENTLASFNPIVALHWPTDDQLYFQTAFIKRMLNETDSVSSFPRWHRLILTPQASGN
jgi:hypothetical protein